MNDGHDSETPQCPDCGSFMQYDDESEEIEMALATGELEEPPSGHWGSWECPRGCGHAE